MRKLVFLFAVLALMSACNKQEEERIFPHRQAMEDYAKAHIPNPETYEFDYEAIEKEYKYVNELVEMRLQLQRQAQNPDADTTGMYETDEKIQRAFEAVGYDVACYEFAIHFWYMGGDDGKMRLPGVVTARYDADGNLMVMTMDPNELPTYPALNMLKEKGLL